MLRKNSVRSIDRIIASADVEAVNKAIEIVNALVKDPEIGEYYKGTVKKITNVGHER